LSIIPCASHELNTYLIEATKEVDDKYIRIIALWGSEFAHSPCKNELLKFYYIMNKIKPKKIIKYKL
jgi:hypothetical protein